MYRSWGPSVVFKVLAVFSIHSNVASVITRCVNRASQIRRCCLECTQCAAHLASRENSICCKMLRALRVQHISSCETSSRMGTWRRRKRRITILMVVKCYHPRSCLVQIRTCPGDDPLSFLSVLLLMGAIMNDSRGTLLKVRCSPWIGESLRAF